MPGQHGPGLLRRSVAVVLLCCAAILGCDSPEPIVIYTVPTKVPEQLQVGNERMLAAMVPSGDQVWFFKVTGPEDALAGLESTFREFVQNIEFSDSKPNLSDLPAGWRRGGDKPMRFASIDIDTPAKQLDLSVSQLGRQSDWDEQVKMNVNRWRGQLGLPASQDKWAGGEPFEIAAADGSSVWVDLVGKPASGAMPMTPPFAGDAPFAQMPPAQTAPASVSPPGSMPPSASEQTPPPTDPRLKFKLPEGWREGRMTSMRMAAFNAGPEDAAAELTVIPAGGDLRGNVARWLGQVREGDAPDDVVDAALANATKVDVDGRPGQRFFLAGEDATQGTAIDATIVPMDGGMSLFVKMTGPAQTVSEQSEAIAEFLKSLELNL